MEGNELQTLGGRTPDYNQLLADIDRGMTRSGYIELLDRIALAYKELTDAMAAFPAAWHEHEYNVINLLVAFFRWLFLGKPSPRSLHRLYFDHSRQNQLRRIFIKECAGRPPTRRTRPIS